MSKIIRFALIILLFVFVGCKKDDPVSSFTVTGDTSVDFNPSQTKYVNYTEKHIRSHNEPTAPKGWSVRKDGNRYVVTAPSVLTGDDVEASGTVKLTAIGVNNVTLTRNVAVSVRQSQEISGEANSIVVTEAGKRFKFKVERAGVSGRRIWSTSKTAVTNVSYEDGWMYFATGAGADFEDANAVIALVGEYEDKVLWSWHIWVTSEEPTVVQVGNYWVMDRNLGASSPADFGMYYQWGRPTPFAGPVTLYNDKGSAMTHSFATTSDDENVHTMEYAVAHPATFIAGLEADNFGWLEFGNDTLWKPGSEYDPCPDGWQVAPREVFEALSLDDAVGEYDGGWMFEVAASGDGASEIFLPAAGRRSFSPSLATWDRNYTNVVNNENGEGSPVGFYWMDGSPKLGSVAFGEDFYYPFGVEGSYAVDTVSNYAAGGFSVRCVKE